MDTALNVSLIDQPEYAEFIAKSHPALRCSKDDSIGHFFIANLDIAEPLLQGLVRANLELAQSMLPRYLKPKALFLGTPFEPYRQDDVLARLPPLEKMVDGLHMLSSRHRAQCIVMTNVSPTHERCSELLDSGFTLLPSFPDMVLNLRDIETFEEYLRLLKAGDRSSVRRNLRVFGERGYEIRQIKNSEPISTNLYEAYLPFFNRAKVKWFPHSPEFFRDATDFSNSTRLFVASDADGELAGFAMGYFDGRVYHAGRLGVRPDLFQQDRVYFALLYRFIEDAISLGAKQLSLEPTAYRLKRHLGAKPRPVVNAIMGTSPFWRTALSLGKPLGYRLLRHLNRPKVLEDHY